MTTLSDSDEAQYEPIDPLKLYFREPYKVKDKIIINQPTIQDIVDYGEHEFYAMLRIFIENTTMCRVQLWDLGIDWNEITDYQLFVSFIPMLQQEQTKVLFGDLDFTLLKPFPRQIPNPNFDETNEESEKNPKKISEIFLYDPSNDIELNEIDYKQIALCLRTMFGIFPKDEFISSKIFREDVIADERERIKIEMAKNKNKSSSTLLPLISGCINHPGFPYKIDELREIGICAFMDSVQRLQIYESTTALLKGAYSGFIDTKGIKPEQFNFMREN